MDRDHPAATLRLSEKFAGQLIFDNPNVTAAGHMLAELYEKCMVRRTYATQIGDKTVGDKVPGIVQRYIDTEFTDAP